MKTLITALLLAATAAWGGEYWVQVLSMGKEAALDKAFLKRIEASGHSYSMVKEGGMQKVRLGAFGSYKEALEALMAIRCRVAPDAFIVSAEPAPKAPAVQTEKVPDAVAVVAKPESAKAPAPEKSADQPAAKEGQAETATATEAAAAVPETAQTEAAAPEKPCVCICDKHARRKAEIGMALSYYKTSPYHRFETEPSGVSW